MRFSPKFSLFLLLGTLSALPASAEVQDSPFIRQNSQIFSVQGSTQVDFSHLYASLLDCLPEQPFFDIDLKLKGKSVLSTGFQDDYLTNSNGAENRVESYLGIYAEIPLMDSRDTRRRIDRRLKFKKEITDDLTAFLNLIHEREYFSQNRQIAQIREGRERQRLAHGVGLLKEHKQALDDAIKFDKEFKSALVKLQALKYRLLAYCEKQKVGAVGRLLDSVIDGGER